MTRHVLCALVVLSATACSTEASRQRHYENGQRYIAQQQYAAAIIELRNVVGLEPNWGAARLALGDAYERDGQPERAYREYQRAADLLPNDPRAQLQALKYLLRARQFEDARVRAEHLLSIDPRNVEAHVARGNALVGLHDLSGAVAAVQEAIAADPTRPESYSTLRRLPVADGRLGEALAAYKQALTIDPRSVSAHLALANFHWSAGDHAAAEGALRSAVALDPRHADAQRALAAFYSATRRYAEAERSLRALVDVSHTTADRLALADFLLARGRLDEARQTLAPLAERPRRSAAAETRLIRLEFLSGNNAAADERLQRLLARSPNYLDALILKAQRSLLEMNWQDAHREANTVLAINPRSTAAYYVRAEAEFRLGRFADAMRSYREVLLLNAAAVDAKVALSRLHLARNEVESAVLYAEEAIRNAPEDTTARLTLVRAWIARGDDLRAASELTRLSEGATPPAEAVVLQASLALRRGEQGVARQMYELALQLEPASREALTALTTMDVFAGQYAAARVRVERALQRETDSGLLALAARVAMAEGDLPRAEALLRQSIAGDVAQTEAFELLARVLEARNQLAEAIREADAAAHATPSDVGARLIAAVAVERSGNLEDAERRYRAALALDPGARLAARNLAAIYAARGENLVFAEQLARQAIGHQPEAQVFATLGTIALKQRLTADAVKHFERAISLEPHRAVFHYLLGIGHTQNGEPHRARSALTEALRLDPAFTDARMALAALPSTKPTSR